MSPDPIAFAADSAILGSPLAVAISYHRPLSSQFAAVAAFSINAVVDTGGEFATPTGPIYADVFLQVGGIPLGPQKGDQLEIDTRAYVVQEIFWDRRAASAHLKVRWTGQ